MNDLLAYYLNHQTLRLLAFYQKFERIQIWLVDLIKCYRNPTLRRTLKLFLIILYPLHGVMWSTGLWSTSSTPIKKGSHCSFMQLKNRENLCEMPRVVKMNDGINKMVFNRNFSSHIHTWKHSQDRECWYQITAEQRINKRSRLYLLINNLSILFAVSCVLASQIITQMPSALCDFTNGVGRFIYSCKSYFKWLTSKLGVYCAKWSAASQPVFLFLPLNWDAEWGEFNLYENTRRQIWGGLGGFSSLSILQLWKGKSFGMQFSIEQTSCSLKTHISACLVQLNRAYMKMPFSGQCPVP